MQNGNGKRPRARHRRDVAPVRHSGNMPELEDGGNPSAGQDGARPGFPPGATEFFGVDEMDGGRSAPSPSREFMTAHTDNMARLLAESVLSPDDVADLVQLEADEQSTWGYVSMTSIAKLRIAASIGLGGRGREDGVKVETMGMNSMMSRAKGWMGRVFGAGGGDPPQGQQTREMGY